MAGENGEVDPVLAMCSTIRYCLRMLGPDDAARATTLLNIDDTPDPGPDRDRNHDHDHDRHDHDHGTDVAPQPRLRDTGDVDDDEPTIYDVIAGLDGAQEETGFWDERNGAVQRVGSVLPSIMHTGSDPDPETPIHWVSNEILAKIFRSVGRYSSPSFVAWCLWGANMCGWLGCVLTCYGRAFAQRRTLDTAWSIQRHCCSRCHTSVHGGDVAPLTAAAVVSRWPPWTSILTGSR